MTAEGQVAILVADLCGFSAMCEADPDAALAGVTTFRRRAARLLRDALHIHFWADNLAATFPGLPEARAAASALHAEFRCSIGIGWGPARYDFGEIWGVEMNRAAKLGEDAAGPGETLTTKAAEAMIR
ncbi:MAG: hypothetical protein ACOY5Y_06930 [Pseudomonadota bacterium]